MTTCLALAKAASVASLLPIINVKATLFGASSHTSGAPGFTASSTPITAGSGSYSISTSSAALRACSSRFGDDEGDALADRAHLVDGEDRARRAKALRPAHVFRHRRRQRAEPVGLDVGAGEHGEHAVGGLGLAGVDPFDAGMGVRRHDHDAVALMRQVEVVDIAAAAGDEARILDPRHGLADAEFLHASPPCFSPGCAGQEEMYTNIAGGENA